MKKQWFHVRQIQHQRKSKYFCFSFLHCIVPVCHCPLMIKSKKQLVYIKKVRKIGIRFIVTDSSNLDKQYSGAHFVSFLFYYYCMDNPILSHEMSHYSNQIYFPIRVKVKFNHLWPKMMMKSGLEKIFLKFLHAEPRVLSVFLIKP